MSARESITMHQVARFLLDGPVLPLLTDTVRVAEVFRAAAMSQFTRLCRRQSPDEVLGFRRPGRADLFSSPALSGKTLIGDMLPSHDHAHYLPTAEGDDPRQITHLTVYSPGGLEVGEQAALTALRRINFGEREPLRVQLIGLGRPEDFTACVFQSSLVWESLTPFVVHRHPKRRGTKKDTPHLTGPDPKAAFVELALRELVERRGMGRLVDVEPLPPSSQGPRPVKFRRSRDRKGDDGWRRPFGLFRLRFESPVRGPICLGYACHFGLGLFRPR